MRIPEIDPTYINPYPQVTERIAANNTIKNILLTGDTGTGKTTFAHQFAAKYQRPCFTLECGAISEPEQILGQWEVVPNRDGNAHTIFRLSPFLEAVQTPNAVIVLNELNRFGNIRAENMLLSLLDHQRSLHVQEIGKTIHVAENVTFFCTINEGARYTATDQLDWALRNRMSRRIEIDWLTPEQEFDILKARLTERAKHNPKMSEFPEEKAKQLIRLAVNTRGDSPISLRQLETTLEEIMLGATLREAIDICWSSVVRLNDLEALAAGTIPDWNKEDAA